MNQPYSQKPFIVTYHGKPATVFASSQMEAEMIIRDKENKDKNPDWPDGLSLRAMRAHPAKIIEYKEYDEDMPLLCPVCHWQGTPKSSEWIEYHDVLFDVSCPNCEKMLLIVNYPLIKND